MTNDSNDEENDLRKQMGTLEISGKFHAVYEGLNIIGRDLRATILLKDVKFSKQHAIISVIDANSHFISDFQSSNGTKLGESKLIPYKFYNLGNADQITFSDVTGIYRKDITKICRETVNESQMVHHNSETQIISSDESNATTFCPKNLKRGCEEKISESQRMFHEAQTQILPSDESKSSTGTHEKNPGKICRKNINESQRLIHEAETQISDLDVAEYSKNSKKSCRENISESQRLKIHEAETQIFAPNDLETQIFEDISGPKLTSDESEKNKPREKSGSMSNKKLEVGKNESVRYADETQLFMSQNDAFDDILANENFRLKLVESTFVEVDETVLAEGSFCGKNGESSKNKNNVVSQLETEESQQIKFGPKRRFRISSDSEDEDVIQSTQENAADKNLNSQNETKTKVNSDNEEINNTQPIKFPSKRLFRITSADSCQESNKLENKTELNADCKKKYSSDSEEVDNTQPIRFSSKRLFRISSVDSSQGDDTSLDQTSGKKLSTIFVDSTVHSAAQNSNFGNSSTGSIKSSSLQKQNVKENADKNSKNQNVEEIAKKNEDSDIHIEENSPVQTRKNNPESKTCNEEDEDPEIYIDDKSPIKNEKHDKIGKETNIENFSQENLAQDSKKKIPEEITISDSETDIEDLEEMTKKLPSTSETAAKKSGDKTENSSDSETDLEDEILAKVSTNIASIAEAKLSTKFEEDENSSKKAGPKSLKESSEHKTDTLFMAETAAKNSSENKTGNGSDSETDVEDEILAKIQINLSTNNSEAEISAKETEQNSGGSDSETDIEDEVLAKIYINSEKNPENNSRKSIEADKNTTVEKIDENPSNISFDLDDDDDFDLMASTTEKLSEHNLNSSESTNQNKKPETPQMYADFDDDFDMLVPTQLLQNLESKKGSPKTNLSKDSPDSLIPKKLLDKNLTGFELHFSESGDFSVPTQLLEPQNSSSVANQRQEKLISGCDNKKGGAVLPANVSQGENIDFSAPTQLLVPENATSDKNPRQNLSLKIPECSTKEKSVMDSNLKMYEDVDFSAPTQLLEPENAPLDKNMRQNLSSKNPNCENKEKCVSSLVNSNLKMVEGVDFSAPTQLLEPENATSEKNPRPNLSLKIPECSTKEKSVMDSNLKMYEDVDFSAPTQLLEPENAPSDKNMSQNLSSKNPNCENKEKCVSSLVNSNLKMVEGVDFSAPTQLLDPENATSEKNPRQNLSLKIPECSTKEKSVMDSNHKMYEDVDFSAPTQLLEPENAPSDKNMSQNLSSKIPNCENKEKSVVKSSLVNSNLKMVEDVDFFAPTQLLEPTSSSVNLRQKDVKSTVPDFDNKKGKLVEPTSKPNLTLDENADFSAPTQLLDSETTKLKDLKSTISDSKSLENPSRVSSNLTLDDDLDFCAPTQLVDPEKTSLPSNVNHDSSSASKTPSSLDFTSKKGTNLNFVAPKKLLQAEKSSKIQTVQIDQMEEDEFAIHFAPTQVSVQDSKERENEECHLAPTQILVEVKAGSSVERSREEFDEDYLAPTQLLSSPGGEFKPDAYFLVPTQILPDQNDFLDGSVFSAPTQILDSADKNLDVAVGNKERQQKTIEDEDENVFMAATQVLILTTVQKQLESSCINPTCADDSNLRLLDSSLEESLKLRMSDAEENLSKFLEPEPSNKSKTLDLETSNKPEETTSGPSKIQNSSVISSGKKSEFSKHAGNIPPKFGAKITEQEPETQLEVDFDLETQRLYLEERTSRPDNPLAHKFNQENTQITETVELASNLQSDFEPTNISNLNHQIRLTEKETGIRTRKSVFKSSNAGANSKSIKTETKTAGKHLYIDLTSDDETDSSSKDSKSNTNESGKQFTSDESEEKGTKKKDKRAPKLTEIFPEKKKIEAEKASTTNTNSKMPENVQGEDTKDRNTKQKYLRQINLEEVGIMHERSRQETSKEKNSDETSRDENIEGISKEENTNKLEVKLQKLESTNADSTKKDNLIPSDQKRLKKVQERRRFSLRSSEPPEKENSTEETTKEVTGTKQSLRVQAKGKFTIKSLEKLPEEENATGESGKRSKNQNCDDVNRVTSAKCATTEEELQIAGHVKEKYAKPEMSEVKRSSRVQERAKSVTKSLEGTTKTEDMNQENSKNANTVKTQELEIKETIISLSASLEESSKTQDMKQDQSNNEDKGQQKSEVERTGTKETTRFSTRLVKKPSKFEEFEMRGSPKTKEISKSTKSLEESSKTDDMKQKDPSSEDKRAESEVRKTTRAKEMSKSSTRLLEEASKIEDLEQEDFRNPNREQESEVRRTTRTKEMSKSSSRSLAEPSKPEDMIQKDSSSEDKRPESEVRKTMRTKEMGKSSNILLEEASKTEDLEQKDFRNSNRKQESEVRRTTRTKEMSKSSTKPLEEAPKIEDLEQEDFRNPNRKQEFEVRRTTRTKEMSKSSTKPLEEAQKIEDLEQEDFRNPNRKQESEVRRTTRTKEMSKSSTRSLEGPSKTDDMKQEDSCNEDTRQESEVKRTTRTKDMKQKDSRNEDKKLESEVKRPTSSRSATRSLEGPSRTENTEEEVFENLSTSKVKATPRAKGRGKSSLKSGGPSKKDDLNQEDISQGSSKSETKGSKRTLSRRSKISTTSSEESIQQLNVVQEQEVKKSARIQNKTPRKASNKSTSPEDVENINKTPKRKRGKGPPNLDTLKAENSEDSDESPEKVANFIRRKVLKLDFSDNETVCSSGTSTSSIVPNRRQKRVLKIEESSSEEQSLKLSSETPNTKRRRCENSNSSSTKNPLSNEAAKHKVVFTMLDDPSLETTVEKLGGSVVDSASECTVLVTNKISRSLKFLIALCLAKPIVHSKWVQDSLQKNTFLDPWLYILEDPESEAKFSCSLKESLKRAREKKLLADYTILLAANKNFDVLKEVIEASGGKCITRIPPKGVKNNIYVVAYEEEKAKFSRYLKQKTPLTVVAAEAIFSGVLQQKLDFNKYLLV